MLDPSIMKIVPAVRSHEVIFGEDRLLKDCPNVVFFHNAKRADAGQLFGSGPIIDSRDSMLQAIDISIRLGFKDIYLHGADLYVRLSSQQEDHMSRLKRSVGIDEDYQQADVENSLFETLGSIAHLRLFPETDPKDMTSDQKQQIADEVDQLAAGLDQISVSPLMYSFGNANVSMIDRVRADHHYRVCASRLVAARGCLDNLGVRVRLLESQGGRLSKFFENTYVQDLPKFDDLELSPDYTLAGKYKKVQ